MDGGTSERRDDTAARRTGTGLEQNRLDAVFCGLADSERLVVVRRLRAADAPVELGDLAHRIASVRGGIVADGGMDGGDATGDVSSEAKRRAYVALFHKHLPALEAASLVEFDPERETVALADFDESVESILEVVPESNGGPSS